MGRGLIGGALWGVVVAGFGLIVVSQVAPPPKPGATGSAVAVVADTTPPVTSPAQDSVVPEDQIAQAEIPAPVDAGSGAAAPAAAVPAAQPPAEAEIAAAPAVSDTGKVATNDAATAALPAAKAASQPPKLPASPEVMAALAPPEGVPALPTLPSPPQLQRHRTRPLPRLPRMRRPLHRRPPRRYLRLPQLRPTWRCQRHLMPRPSCRQRMRPWRKVPTNRR